MTTLFRAFHVTDLHFSPLNRTPQSRSDTYHEDVKFEWDSFVDIVKRDKPDCILISGDFFHNKNQQLYSPPDIEHYRQFFAKLGVPVNCIAGNHDLPKSSYALVEGTAYDNLLHASAGRILDVHLQPARYEIPELGAQVYVHGLPYYPLEELLTRLPALDAELAKQPGIHIVLLHPDALPTADDSLPFDVVSWKDLLNLLPHANVLCLGHIHTSFPLYKGTGPFGPQFVSKPWSFARIVKDYFATSKHLEHTHRPMYTDIHLWAGEDGIPSLKLDYTEIPYVPFDRAFNPESLRRDIEKSGKISSFITNLRQSYGTIENAFTVEDPEAFLARAQLTQPVRDIIHRYLDDQ